VNLPSHLVPRVPEDWSVQPFDIEAWSGIPALSPFILADGSGAAKQQTQVRLAYSSEALYVCFDCQDDDIWGTYTKRDDPIYDEEVVELFIAPGTETPHHYFEFEVSPNSVLFDCKITNPSGHYDDHLLVDKAWNAEGLEWHAKTSPERQQWWAFLKIPWQDISGFHGEWRANFYRIERSRKSGTELSCWSPTFSTSFHVPAYFGRLIIA
jgi:Carbohydrate-binding family 9